MIHPIPRYNRRTFTSVWDSYEKFLNDYHDADIDKTIDDAHTKTLYYLLYAKYGNSPIVNRDVTQFKYKVWTIIWQYGAEWQKRLAIQKDIKDLTDDELREGTRGIFNQANNPSIGPSTGDTGELSFVDAQTVSKSKKSKIDAKAIQWDSLNSGYTKVFIDKFKPLFSRFVGTTVDFLYPNEYDDDEVDEDD